MKVLIITPTVADYVSVGKIAVFLYEQLKRNGHEAQLVYFGLNGRQPDYVSINRNELLAKIRYKLVLNSNFRIQWHYFGKESWKKLIKKNSPDVIQLIQPMQEYINVKALFSAIGDSGIPCVYTMIDESAYLGNCDNAYNCTQFMNKDGCLNCHGENAQENLIDYGGYWNRKGCINKARIKAKCYACVKQICFAAPKWVIGRAEQSNMLKGHKFCEADEFVNNEDIYYPRQPDHKMLKAYGIDISKILFLNVARYSNKRKGIQYYIELAKRFEQDERYQFIHIGYDGNGDALPNNYIALPFIKDQNIMAMFYSSADLFMITSLADTMPNVCLEALSCGTPVCGFRISGIPYVADERIGTFVETGNIYELSKIVSQTRKKSVKVMLECREYAVKRYSANSYVNKMIDIYSVMMRGFCWR